MESVRSIMEDVEVFSTLVADAILKRTAPVKDELSTREARAAYGTRWLREVTEAGLVQAYTDGNRKVFSRHQLDCLRAAQRQHANQIMHNHNHYNHDTEVI